MKNRLHQILLLIIVLMIWEGFGYFHFLNELILPPPSDIINCFIDLLFTGELFEGIIFSFKRVIIGFLISLITAVPLALFLGTNSDLKKIFTPFVSFLRPIPPIAWIPLAILWFGVGEKLSFFITMIASFFPIFTNTLAGVENVSRQHLDVAKCFGANKTTILLHVIIPSSLPFILSGVRTGLGFAWMAVVAAEMVTAFTGLGYMITMNQQLLRSDKVIVGMITIGLMGMIMDNMTVFIRKKLVKWS